MNLDITEKQGVNIIKFHYMHENGIVKSIAFCN